jgi:hypothetical protein
MRRRTGEGYRSGFSWFHERMNPTNQHISMWVAATLDDHCHKCLDAMVHALD